MNNVCLNGADVRSIDRAIGIIWGAVAVEDTCKREELIYDALEALEVTIAEAEKRGTKVKPSPVAHNTFEEVLADLRKHMEESNER